MHFYILPFPGLSCLTKFVWKTRLLLCQNVQVYCSYLLLNRNPAYWTFQIVVVFFLNFHVERWRSVQRTECRGEKYVPRWKAIFPLTDFAKFTFDLLRSIVTTKNRVTFMDQLFYFRSVLRIASPRSVVFLSSQFNWLYLGLKGLNL